MLNSFVLTIVSQDKPGVVETIANVVSGNLASWQESSFSQLAGKFAGVVKIQAEPEREDDLLKSLNALSAQGIHIQIEACSGIANEQATENHATFSAVGPDRKGIVREFSQAFSSYGINIDNLKTSLSSMPYSGDPLFEAEGKISIPANVEILDMEEKLMKVADELGFDFTLNWKSDD